MRTLATSRSAAAGIGLRVSFTAAPPPMATRYSSTRFLIPQAQRRSGSGSEAAIPFVTDRLRGTMQNQ